MVGDLADQKRLAEYRELIESASRLEEMAVSASTEYERRLAALSSVALRRRARHLMA